MLSRIARQAVLPIVVLLAAALLWGGGLWLRSVRTGDGFDFVRWEVESLPSRPLYLLGTLFREPEPAGEALAGYFGAPDRTVPAVHAQENAVEGVIADRITTVLREQGIHWPPVAFELADSPRVLVVSPRERIQRLAADPLRPDLTAADVQRLEGGVERDPALSALVVRTGGVAAYPAIVLHDDDYRGTVAAAAHEWVHHYLTFHPLGRAYFSTPEARTINETVADIVGDEVARVVVERWGLPAGTRPASPEATQSRAATERALRALRLDVDALLAVGRLPDAERRMAQVREELAAAGVRYRRINQAFFAWTGSYAARGDAVDPLGAQLHALYQRSGSVGAFLAAVQRLSTRGEVDRASPPRATATPEPGSGD